MTEKEIPQFSIPLLPVPSTISSPDDNLCSSCTSLQLRPSRFIVSAEEDKPQTGGRPDENIGTVEEIRRNTHCPFRRLVLKALGGADVPISDGGKPVYVMMKWGTAGTPSMAYKIWNILLYATTDKGSRQQVLPKSMRTNPKITLLANDSPTESKTMFPRLIRADAIDLDLVRTWISVCQYHHGPPCDKSRNFAYESEKPMEQIPSFRLIDVVDNCIVRAPNDCRYFTLSYVWGRVPVFQTLKSNVRSLEKPGSLLRPEYRDKIPKTILNAIQVTKDLGFRYLWVDSLCIIQDDETGSKAEAIAKMDLVYSSGFLTIIATGPNANAGIQGVCSNPRGETQIVEEIGPNFRLVAELPSFNFMQDSIYSTRAWTYQERHFTPRNLTFVGGQVSFSCSNGYCDEDKVENPIMLARPSPPTIPDLASFFLSVQAYSDLSLSFDSDIHNAFAGLMRYFKAKLDFDLVYGIPDKFFDWSLLWTPHAHQVRREVAPSWSWTGWQGQSWNRFPSWFSKDPAKVYKGLRAHTWIIWYHRRAHDSPECDIVWSDHSSTATTSSFPLKHNFYGGDIQHRFAMDCTQTVPTSRTLVGAPTYVADVLKTGSGFLQFWTVSLRFRVAMPTSRYRRSIFDTRLTQARVGIFGKDGRELGTLWVDQNWYGKPGHVPGVHEFILLCEAKDTLTKPQNATSNGVESWTYIVMLVENHDGGWVERVAIGSISKGDVAQALEEGPVWKEIILG
ncbi:hypothetical protein D9613_003810 [Agrocybe pediades]|uniref:Heterokaryon incompatibility domain-containing protein n=1 Tax=Agrocybe pediades TaxID=84607 RepID=A0A8H4QIB6_9AGAR|nr:hypothetical protein D9613_003810 [Agrocybe pediades]